MHGGATSSISSKLLSQLLKFIEGVQGGASNSVILATNRPDDLDPALLSRCAATVQFDLPGDAQRAAIWQRYAKQLAPAETAAAVRASAGMSGRDIKRACEVAERRHVAELQRAGITDPSRVTPPPLALYTRALEERSEGVLALQDESSGQPPPVPPGQGSAGRKLKGTGRDRGMGTGRSPGNGSPTRGTGARAPPRPDVQV